MDVLGMMFREGRRKGLLRNVNPYVCEYILNSHTHENTQANAFPKKERSEGSPSLHLCQTI